MQCSSSTRMLYSLSLHDALPIYVSEDGLHTGAGVGVPRHTRPFKARFRQRDPFGSEGIHGEWLGRSEEHTSELQSRLHLVCRLLLEKINGVALMALRSHPKSSDF